MDLRQLEIFVQVARRGSFTGAANALHMAQPAVSIAIKKLEQELALPLLNRGDRKVSLTPEGEVLLRHADTLLRQANNALLEMTELHQLKRGIVTIGVPGMVGSYYFPPILMAFKSRYPELKIRVVEGGTREILGSIKRGELDMGIVISSDIPSSMHSRPVLREEMVACVAVDHPLAESGTISYQRFFAEDLALFREDYFHREIINKMAEQVGLTPKVAFETNLINLIKTIVKQGFAISTLLRMVIKDEPDIVPLSFSEPIFLELSVAWQKSTYLSRANQAFVDFLLANAKPT